jgi:hypothetical protein
VHRYPVLYGLRYQGSVHVEYCQKIIKRRIIGGCGSREGVNHVYPVLWLLCAFWVFSCLCD